MNVVRSIIVLSLVLLVGCAVPPKPDPLVKNPRIIERDLTFRPVQVGTPGLKPDPIKLLAALENLQSQRHDIEFENDSQTRLVLESQKTLEGLREVVKLADSVILIGYSNGTTSIGNAQLASQRAETIAAKLQEYGLQRSQIKTFASWSPTLAPEDTPKGVQVIIFSRDPAQSA